MTTLANWMQRNAKTQKQLAQEIGVSQPVISAILSGLPASRKVAKAIVEVTGPDVMLETLTIGPLLTDNSPSSQKRVPVTLLTYLIALDISPHDFAREIGKTSDEVRSICKGEQPSLEVAVAVVKGTCGCVPLEMMIYEPNAGPIGLEPVRAKREQSKKRKRRI